MFKIKIFTMLTTFVFGFSLPAYAGFLDGDNNLAELIVIEKLFEDDDNNFDNLFQLIILDRLLSDDEEMPEAEETTPPVTTTPKPVTPQPTGALPDPATQTVKIALIDLDTNGSVGCGDNLALVDKTVPATTTPFRSSIEQLLAEKSPSEHYTAFKNSSLTLDRAAIENGTATIELSGNLSLGGVCDNPRVTTQIEETARQFAAVQEVQVFLNGESLEDALSQR